MMKIYLMVFLHQDFSRQEGLNIRGNIMISIFKRILVLFLFITSIPLTAQDDFSSFIIDEDLPELKWSGEGSLITRYNSEYNNMLNSNIDIYPEINLELDYIGDRSEFHGEIDFSAYPTLLPEQLIEEAYFQLYFDKFNMELGYIKLIWGKGDRAYTLDNLNAADYTDFINPSYIDRKIAEAMIKINFPLGMQGKVEAVYTPVFTSDIYPDTGDWIPTAYNIINTPNTTTISDSQFGLRFSNSMGGFDLSASYQYTFLRESLTDSAVSTAPFISWDRIHLFGAETAFVVAAFNIWAEAAYYLTRDFSGKDPLIHNNQFLYLVGFSRDIMIHNISLNIQIKSKLKLAPDKITGTFDIDFKSDSIYNTYLITAGLKDSFLNEKITAELNGAYSIEKNDFMVTPELGINLIEDTWLNIKYSFFNGDSNTLYGQFENNNFMEIKLQYSF